MKNQDSNKVYGYDMISILMLKFSGESVCRPLNIIFKTCFRTGNFTLEWKKANVVHEKNNKQINKKYLPLPFLPICGEIFER